MANCRENGSSLGPFYNLVLLRLAKDNNEGKVEEKIAFAWLFVNQLKERNAWFFKDENISSRVDLWVAYRIFCKFKTHVIYTNDFFFT